MSKKRLAKSKGNSDGNAYWRGEKEKEREKITSAAKSRKHSNSVKRDRINGGDTKEPEGDDNESIIWREPQFNKEVAPNVQGALESPFVFKEAMKSPKSSVCEVQLNMMFETSDTRRGSTVYATLNNKGKRNDSVASPMSRRPSRLSSFTSYSSVDNGYEIVFSPAQNDTDAESDKKDSSSGKYDLFTSDKRMLVIQKITDIIELNSARDVKLTEELKHSKTGWKNIPQWCMDVTQDGTQVCQLTYKSVRELAQSMQ